MKAAAKEFDALAQAVAGKQGTIEAAFLVTHAEDGAAGSSRPPIIVVARECSRAGSSHAASRNGGQR